MRYLNGAALTITPIVAYGLCVLLVILGALTLESYNDIQRDLTSRLQSRQLELATLKAIENTDVWAARLEQSIVLRKQAEDKIWRGRTSGVIAAELQQVLGEISKKHKMNDIKINIDSEPSQLEEIQILRFTFTGRIAAGKDTIDFYSDIARYKEDIIIVELNSSNSIRDRRPSNINLSGIIPIRLETEVAEQAP